METDKIKSLKEASANANFQMVTAILDSTEFTKKQLSDALKAVIRRCNDLSPLDNSRHETVRNLFIAAHKLIKHGADINAVVDYESIIDNCVKHKDTFMLRHLLSQHGNSVNVRTFEFACSDINYMDADALKILVQFGKNSLKYDFSKSTIFYNAATFKCFALCDILIESGSNVNTQDDDGTTALINLFGENCMLGDEDIVESIQYLLARGVDVTIRDNKGLTALDRAEKTANENPLSVEFLRSVYESLIMDSRISSDEDVSHLSF